MAITTSDPEDSDMSNPRITLQYPVMDTPDLDASSAFYTALLGGRVVDRDDDWHTVVWGDGAQLAFQLAPGQTSPDWPRGQQQLHLDFAVDDIHAAHEHALNVGARQLTRPDLDTASGFVVYADPAGHPFCLCWGV